MTPRHRLRAERDFVHARAAGRAQRSALFTLTAAPRAEPGPSRFGFVVSKRVGNAVTRNRVKRRLRAIIQARLTSIAAGFDVIITAQPATATSAFADLAAAAEAALRRARLWTIAPPGDHGAPATLSPTEGLPR